MKVSGGEFGCPTPSTAIIYPTSSRTRSDILIAKRHPQKVRSSLGYGIHLDIPILHPRPVSYQQFTFDSYAACLLLSRSFCVFLLPLQLLLVLIPLFL